MGGWGRRHFTFSCTAQRPATCWVHAGSGQVPCWPADNRPERVDRKHMFVRYCICQQLDTGEWGPQAGRGEGKRERKVQGVRKETALTVTGGTGGGCSVTSASWRSLRASCVAGVQRHALCVRPLLLSQQPGVAA